MRIKTHAGFFEGIGGFALGAERAGLKTTYHCEIDEYKANWLKKRFKDAQHESDIKTANGLFADVWTAGFPCQNISIANSCGKDKKGLEGSQSSLWYPFFELVRVHRPPFVVLENSPNLTKRGLETILCNFAQIGYYVEWQCLCKQSLGYEDERADLCHCLQ